MNRPPPMRAASRVAQIVVALFALLLAGLGMSMGLTLLALAISIAEQFVLPVVIVAALAVISLATGIFIVWKERV